MPSRSNRILRKVGLWLATLLLVAVSLDLFAAAFQRWQAGRLLALVQRIQTGKTSREEFQRKADELLRFTGLNGETDLLGSATRVSYTMYNRALLFHGVQSNDGAMEYRTFPYWFLFEVNVSFENGIAVRKHALFFTPGIGRPEFSASADEHLSGFELEDRRIPSDPGHHSVYIQTSSDNAWHRIWVEDDNLANDTDRRADWNFNLGCMTKWSGCRDSREILPNIAATPIQRISEQ